MLVLHSLYPAMYNRTAREIIQTSVSVHSRQTSYYYKTANDNTHMPMMCEEIQQSPETFSLSLALNDYHKWLQSRKKAIVIQNDYGTV